MLDRIETMLSRFTLDSMFLPSTMVGVVNEDMEFLHTSVPLVRPT